jgi:crotonobetainyl-CoA:carnitine CoA-transferase CaiB-like acyl-CoA transferase
MTQCAALRRFILDGRVAVALRDQRDPPGRGPRSNPYFAGISRPRAPAGPPLQDRPGYDPLMQAFGGLMTLTGEDGREPVRTGPSIIDQGSAMWAVIGILSALHRRTATGEGCEIGASLYETALCWTNLHMASYLASGRVPRRMGSENFGICPYKAYQARDGWVVVAAGNNNLFQRLADTRPSGMDERGALQVQSDRVTNRDQLNPLWRLAIASDTAAALG